jgi:anti-sigma factor RsiW
VTNRSPTEEELRCVEVAEALTAYLEGAVDKEDRRRIDSHLAGCPGCSAAVDQFRTLINLSGRLTAADVVSIDPLVRDRLFATLRATRRK